MDWREKLDPVTQEYFNGLLKKVHIEKKAYTSAKDISKAQMWTALALLMKEVVHLELEIKHLEKQLSLKKKGADMKKHMRKL